MELNILEDKMKKAIEHLEEEYSTIRAGRANPAILNKVDGKEKMTVFGMNPPTSEVAYQWEMFGFAVLQSLGIKADEL